MTQSFENSEPENCLVLVSGETILKIQSKPTEFLQND